MKTIKNYLKNNLPIIIAITIFTGIVIFSVKANTKAMDEYVAYDSTITIFE